MMNCFGALRAAIPVPIAAGVCVPMGCHEEATARRRNYSATRNVASGTDRLAAVRPRTGGKNQASLVERLRAHGVGREKNARPERIVVQGCARKNFGAMRARNGEPKYAGRDRAQKRERQFDGKKSGEFGADGSGLFGRRSSIDRTRFPRLVKRASIVGT